MDSREEYAAAMNACQGFEVFQCFALLAGAAPWSRRQPLEPMRSGLETPAPAFQ